MPPIALVATLLTALLLPGTGAAQTNWITNGDFSNGLNGWTAGGVGVNPQVESFDTTGLGASPCFGIHAGYPINTPNGPYILSQTVIVVPATYELYADLVCSTTSLNADGGTVWIKINGVEATRFAFGAVPPAATLRNVICARSAPKTGGQLKLEVGFERGYAAAVGRTPRIRIDNLAMHLATGPSFCMRGARRPGDTVQIDVDGTANAAFAVFIGTKIFAGVPVPPLGGTLRLDPSAGLVLFLGGKLDAQGGSRSSFRLPPTVLPGISLYYQAAELTGPSSGGIGIHHDYGLQR